MEISNIIIMCTCGKKMKLIDEKSITDHINSIHHKKYVDKNKDLSPEERINKTYNKEKDYNLNYYNKNKEDLLKKIKCEICQGNYDKTHKSRHFNSRKHLLKMVKA